MKSFLGHWALGFAGAAFLLLYEGVEDTQTLGYVGVFSGFLWWYIATQIWRTRRCTGRCKGTGRIGDPMDKGKYWRACPDCGGTGRQLRMFARRREGE